MGRAGRIGVKPGSRRSVSSSNATPGAILRNIHVAGPIAEIDADSTSLHR